MNLKKENFEEFADENHTLLKTTLGTQFEKHFNLLVEAVPSIKNIEWTSSQEDEMVFDLRSFSLEKNNGYVYHYELYNDNQPLSDKEFTQQEIELINGFKNYLEYQSSLIVKLFGSDNFKLENTQTATKKLKM